MKTLVIATWIFINLAFFGVCIYLYLLWSYYWASDGNNGQSTTLNYDQEIYYYNHGDSQSKPFFKNSTPGQNLTDKLFRKKHSLKQNDTSIIFKNSQPRFLSFQNTFDFDNQKYGCLKEDNESICFGKTTNLKKVVLAELNKVLVEEGNVLKEKNNPYDVTLGVSKKHYLDSTPQEILEKFLTVKIHTLKKRDFEGVDGVFKNYLPRKELFEKRHFKSCAVVASSGGLSGSNLGKIIDSHNVVVRFNNAPTQGFEEDVGKKTTVRIVNSQVASRSDFPDLKIFENVTLVVWDPKNYKSTLEEWYSQPEHSFFENYKKYKRKHPKSRFYIVNPTSLWDLWTFLQSCMIYRIRKNPPSSGFLGISLLLPHCDRIDVFEYVPSVRASRKCHYYDKIDNPACTFGVWHPLAAEKLLAYYLNVANDTTVFQTGFIEIPGNKKPNSK